MKTVLNQILEDDFEHMDDLLMWIREYGLEKEREQIEVAYYRGKTDYKAHRPLNSKQYYNETYNQNK